MLFWIGGGWFFVIPSLLWTGFLYGIPEREDGQMVLKAFGLTLSKLRIGRARDRNVTPAVNL